MHDGEPTAHLSKIGHTICIACEKINFDNHFVDKIYFPFCYNK